MSASYCLRMTLSGLLFLMINNTTYAANTDQLGYQQPYVEVKGQSEKSISPDYVAIQLVVNVTAKNAGIAKLRNDKAVNKIFDIAQQFNIPKSDQLADQIQRYPQYEWQNNSRQYRGETVRRTITLKARDFNRYSLLMDQLSSTKDISINGTQPRLDNLEKVQLENLQQALKNARNKAQIMLSTYGEELDKVIMITEGNTRDNQIRPYMTMRSADIEGGRHPAPAEFIFEPIKVKSDVRVRFSIR